MAVQAVLGGDLAWVSDVEPGPMKVLAHRYPHVPNLGDVTAVDWSQVASVDVICGGSPCQDVSTAGKRAGMAEGTRSNLWVAMRDAIAVIRPRYVIWENVHGVTSARASSAMESDPGLLGDHPAGTPALRALGRVCGDLSGLGYDARWMALRASDVGAPHLRRRVFLLAHTSSHGGRLGDGDGGTPTDADGPAVPSSDTDSAGRQGRPDPAGAASPRRPDDTIPSVDWGHYAAAIHRWEQAIGRTAPAPTRTGRRGRPQLSPRFVEWLMGLPDGWVTAVPRVTRTEALRMLGNGVVPQQAAAAIDYLLTTKGESHD